MFEVNEGIIQVSYIIATILFILALGGLSNQEIADQLVVSERTVRAHISNILGKLHLANRTQAALYALRRGIASLDEEL